MGRDEHGAAALAATTQEKPDDGLSRLTVQVARGLVGQEQARLDDQGAGDGDALLLATRELIGAMVGARAQADLLSTRQRASAALARRGAAKTSGTSTFSTAVSMAAA